MFYYVKDHELFILLPETGRVFKIIRQDYEFPGMVLDKILQFANDIDELIKNENAIRLRDQL